MYVEIILSRYPETILYAFIISSGTAHPSDPSYLISFV
jgi:hypothetical protein